MTCAYMVCGMQLVFLTTHLPSYLAICGLDPMLSAQTLGMIGGFNVLGSLFFGWAGQRWNKLALLGAIYILRSLALAWYFMLPATPGSTLLFGAIMGSLNMSVIQVALPDQIRGRVMAIMMMAHGFMPLGIIPISAVAETWGIGLALALSGGLLALSLFGLRVWIPELATIDRGHDDDSEAPAAERPAQSKLVG